MNASPKFMLEITCMRSAQCKHVQILKHIFSKLHGMWLILSMIIHFTRAPQELQNTKKREKLSHKHRRSVQQIDDAEKFNTQNEINFQSYIIRRNA